MGKHKRKHSHDEEAGEVDLGKRRKYTHTETKCQPWKSLLKAENNKNKCSSHKKKKGKKERTYSSSNSDSYRGSSSSDERDVKMKHKKAKRKHHHKRKEKERKRKEKKGRGKEEKGDVKKVASGESVIDVNNSKIRGETTMVLDNTESTEIGPSLPASMEQEIDNKDKRNFKPMTKEEYEKQQSIIRRVYDPETGRSRLVKGDGEILEEIVSYEQHKNINKTATKGDGDYFAARIGLS